MNEPEYVTITMQVPIEDIDGMPIREGSVLQNTKDKDRGVVVWIGRKGQPCLYAMAAVGDVAIRTRQGCTRITNQYKQWRHLPRNEQTYDERLVSWFQKPFEADPDRRCSADTQVAIDGIMSLLPIDIVDWESGPWPDDLSDALQFLAQHLTDITKKP